MKRLRVVSSFCLALALAMWPVLSALLTSSSPKNPHFVMSVLSEQLSEQYHECVPVGWNPAPVAGTYYPAYSAEYWENGVWLHPFWLGRITRAELTDPNAQTAYTVMNALIRAGMLDRTTVPGGFLYRLTPSAIPYYFEDNRYGDNPDHFPYFCYSRLVPKRVVWIRPVGHRAFRVNFEWHVESTAAWANDAFLRRHSVVLPPWGSPVIADFSNATGDWEIRKLSTRTPMLPRAVDPAAWPGSTSLRQLPGS